jgi:hypothetical protein
MLTKKDLEIIKSRGADPDKIKLQIDNFEKGFPYAKLIAPATLENGMLKFETNRINDLVKKYDSFSKNYDLIKFVPASGAASRMFSHLFAFKERYSGNPDEFEQLLKDESLALAFAFFDGLKNFAFYEELENIMAKSGHPIDECITNMQHHLIIDYLLSPKGLSYASLPKGLISFHRYGDKVRKAIEEHLIEGAHYCGNSKNEVHIHFTLSPEHISSFKELIKTEIPIYEKEFGVKYFISHSIQQPSTDTIAVDMDNKPFREADNSLLFRPGGHGALIGNLGELKADIVFIKNIDNIVPDCIKDETYRYKKVIGGLLISMQEKIFNFMELLEDGNLDENQIKEIEQFAIQNLMIRVPEEYSKYDLLEKIDFLYNRLNRPVRVCGMVKNEGEPGGGPFWVKNSEGEISLQIIESSQVDLKNSEQANIFRSATHFNPVDLVCGLKNFKDEKFDLEEFIDPETGFISIKTKDGRKLKAQELPGLWNGAMAHWITIFVEVPIITFNPVKTVNDLLRKEHQ